MLEKWLSKPLKSLKSWSFTPKQDYSLHPPGALVVHWTPSKSVNIPPPLTRNPGNCFKNVLLLRNTE
ncbi:hypothetical protein DPMN_133076 [Dreissena polymorpha]|uniref:Uncharacterized protein n=1 Tax=Dreissena polymorpha TaxID=45954 RepID=A0A9D4FTN1_DREPO|nr:hypothetical protein DPMN_133076 [Dreissena polymorpha]